MNAHELLKAARARIEDPKMWWRGFDEHCTPGGGCMQLAVADAMSAARIRMHYSIEQEAMGALLAAIGSEPGFIAPIWNFNDDPKNTHADMLAAFDRAIASLTKPTNISIFTDMLTTQAPMAEHQSAVDTCGNG